MLLLRSGGPPRSTSNPTDCSAAARSCSRSASSSSSNVGVGADARTSMTPGRSSGGCGGGGGRVLMDLRRRPKRSASDAAPRILPRCRRGLAVGVCGGSAVVGRERGAPRAGLWAKEPVSSSASELEYEPESSESKSSRSLPLELAFAPEAMEKVRVRGAPTPMDQRSADLGEAEKRRARLTGGVEFESARARRTSVVEERCCRGGRAVSMVG
ncbi:hypothetical protein BC834DRAFT_884634 [Gloeopeniophorella convolvens]|nr:hypothetical protein BC834DRAFT_884634 [Gloeopeniophorella convolvens]